MENNTTAPQPSNTQPEVQPVQASSQPTAAATPAPTQPQKKSGNTLKYVLIGVGVMLLLCCLCFVLGLLTLDWEAISKELENSSTLTSSSTTSSAEGNSSQNSATTNRNVEYDRLNNDSDNFSTYADIEAKLNDDSPFSSSQRFIQLFDSGAAIAVKYPLLVFAQAKETVTASGNSYLEINSQKMITRVTHFINIASDQNGYCAQFVDDITDSEYYADTISINDGFVSGFTEYKVIQFGTGNNVLHAHLACTPGNENDVWVVEVFAAANTTIDTGDTEEDFNDVAKDVLGAIEILASTDY